MQELQENFNEKLQQIEKKYRQKKEEEIEQSKKH